MNTFPYSITYNDHRSSYTRGVSCRHFPNDPSLHAIILALLDDPNGVVVREALTAAELLTPDEALIAGISERIRLGNGIQWHPKFIDPSNPEWTDRRLLSDLSDFNSRVRERAIRVLSHRNYGEKKTLSENTLKTLQTLQDDSRPWVRQAARRTVYLIH